MVTDHLIIGAGAAGLWCARELGLYGQSAIILEKSSKPGKKVLISGGGRCNFTNVHARPEHYYSQNPHFCKSALSQFTAADFIQWIEQNQIAYHEKHLGQLFCDNSSMEILSPLLAEIAQSGSKILQKFEIQNITKEQDHFVVEGSQKITAKNIVVATGGLSFPSAGATDFGYILAQQFGHTIIPCRPALVPFMHSQKSQSLASIAGISLPVKISYDNISFVDDLLFTHHGLSGPAVLQISTQWLKKMPIIIDFFPNNSLASLFENAKKEHPHMQIASWLAMYLPKRLAQYIGQILKIEQVLVQLTKEQQKLLFDTVHRFKYYPETTLGYHKAEVTVGGVNTKEISSKTMESMLCPGLYMIGEVLDVTGWLGGYNLQWAWASAHQAAKALASSY